MGVVKKRRMRMKEEFGEVDLFELTGDQSGGQEGEGKSEARERTLGAILYCTIPYCIIPYHTIPNHNAIWEKFPNNPVKKITAYLTCNTILYYTITCITIRY